MQLGKFLNTPTGKIMMSIILGFGLASLFRTVCKEKNCLIFVAPPHDEIDGKIYKYQDKCYSYKSVSTKCDPKKQDVKM